MEPATLALVGCQSWEVQCNAQGDTKPIAKAILKKFKSLNRVFKADVKELETVEGVGPISAILIKFVGELLTELYGENLKIETKADKITDKEALLKFLRNKIGYEDVEKFYVIYLSSSNEVIAFEESSSGTLDRSSIYPREIYKRVIMENAKSIIIAHNHPSGNTCPSKCDIDITNEIAKGLKNFGALLIEHIIITRDSYFSFLEEGLI
ncbi:JAB domain-containing protein [Fusobacterium pseudoperiodonticum]|uniref:JAB domain-containing protein n=1 Tax=Fusobacterium pseudoperiodonticum TaxID=2663009 RepID=UPI001CEF809B